MLICGTVIRCRLEEIDYGFGNESDILERDVAVTLAGVN